MEVVGVNQKDEDAIINNPVLNKMKQSIIDKNVDDDNNQNNYKSG